MTDPKNVKVEPDSVKAADPGVAFTVKTIDGTPFDCPVMIDLNVLNYNIEPHGSYTSKMIIDQDVKENRLECLLPFGDKNWQTEKGGKVIVDIVVYLMKPDGTSVRMDPNFRLENVTAQDKHFLITVVDN